MSIETIGFLAMCAFNIGAICYGYGALNNKVKNCESDFKQSHAAITELFQRLNALEILSGRFEDSVGRFEQVLGNGINNAIAQFRDRLTKMEQHCADTHKS